MRKGIENFSVQLGLARFPNSFFNKSNDFRKVVGTEIFSDSWFVYVKIMNCNGQFQKKKRKKEEFRYKSIVSKDSKFDRSIFEQRIFFIDFIIIFCLLLLFFYHMLNDIVASLNLVRVYF